MTERIPQSTTLRVPLQAYLTSDHVSPATGKTIAVTISKNGAAYGNPSVGATNATEIGSGSYYVDISTTDSGTLGPLFVKCAQADIDTIITIYNVVSATSGGYTNLDAAVSTRLGIAGYTAPPTATENADALLNRDMSAVSDTNSRSPLNAFRFLRNKWDLAAGTLTVKKENDSTTAWTSTIASDAAAVPVIGSDPA